MKDLAKILDQVIKQDQSIQKDRTIEPLYNPEELRIGFVKRLNWYCMKNSNNMQPLKIDEETEIVIELICQYLNNEVEFEKDGRSLKKGLLLCGNFGSGKTQMMNVYKDMKNKIGGSVGIKTCTEMNMLFLEFDSFSGNQRKYEGIKTFGSMHDNKTERIFDDLGEEETTINDYGNKLCIMAHIISERYKGFNSGVVTHFTTNLSMKQIGDIYGGRIESRINQMCNIIKLGSKKDSIDYRKTV